MSEQRLSNRWRALPVAIALSAAPIELSCLGGIFFPDTASYLFHTSHAGFEVPFQTRNPAYPLLLDALCLLLPAGARMVALVLLQQLCVTAIP
ncbi:MAG: hypothetical protein EXS13_08775 [Planctomycetes bacterium]|nr:hypothetical protein [Planctomycetota bacterium]